TAVEQALSARRHAGDEADQCDGDPQRQRRIEISQNCLHFAPPHRLPISARRRSAAVEGRALIEPCDWADATSDGSRSATQGRGRPAANLATLVPAYGASEGLATASKPCRLGEDCR